MLIASRFKSVGWVVTCALAALACYLVSLKVAAKRAELGDMAASIMTARQEIQRLQTELGTRGRLVQLERWNADVLALSAPTAQQYVTSPVQLASFAAPPPMPAAIAPAPVQQASVEAAPQGEPKVIQATYTVTPAAAPQAAHPKLAAAEDKPAPVAEHEKKIVLASAAAPKKAAKKVSTDKASSSSSAVASAYPVKKKSKPASDAKSTALASADTKKAKADKARKASEKTELAAAKPKKAKPADKASETRLAAAKKSDGKKLASAKKDDGKKLAAADRKTKPKAAKEASPVKLALATVTKKKVSHDDAAPRATVRKTGLVKTGRDRIPGQRIAMLDDHALTAIGRAARTEASAKKNRQ